MAVTERAQAEPDENAIQSRNATTPVVTQPQSTARTESEILLPSVGLLTWPAHPAVPAH
jgi:hypothetical protein